MPINRPLVSGLLAATLLAGCAWRPKEVAVAPPPPPAPAPKPMPQPPAGATAGMTIPARLPDGSYATPNRALSEAATLWHVRTALNVAALGCRGANEAQLIASYNALLRAEKAPLAKAQAALIKEYAATSGAKGQAAYDDAMTRLYNYWAQPPAQQAFCDAATAVLAEAPAVTPDTLPAFANRAIATLDQPFVAFYGAYDSYRVELASWQRARMMASLSPVAERPVMAVGAASTVGVAAAPPQPPAKAPRLDYDPAIFAAP